MTTKEEAEACVDVKDKLGCAKEFVVRHKKDECSPKLVLLVQPDCDPCAKVQRELAKDIEAGLIKKVVFDSPEGTEIIKANKIEGIPSLLLLDCRNKSIV